MLTRPAYLLGIYSHPIHSLVGTGGRLLVEFSLRQVGPQEWSWTRGRVR